MNEGTGKGLGDAGMGSKAGGGRVVGGGGE